MTQLTNLVRVEWVMPVYGSLRLSARAEDERSFEAMFKRHHAPLLSYCRHMLGDRDEAEDALQQTFIRAHRAMLGGTKPRAARPWLYAIARNCCLSAIATRKPTAPLDDHMPMLEGLSEQVHQREDLRELVACIARLPEDQRSALLLAELEDLSHREIAGIVGCPVSKVKALIYQARSALIADRDALCTPCRDVREQLAVARAGELRRGPLRRHLNLCAGCRDFQLAVGSQRQSLAAVLPVLPTAGLASAILGHAAVHTAGTAAGGAGLSASGAAATSTAVGAGTGATGGSGAGVLLGGGLATKLAVGGTVAVLATAGAVAIRHPAHAAQRSIRSGSPYGTRRPDAEPATQRAGVSVLNAAFVQTDEGAPATGKSGSGASDLALAGVSGPEGAALTLGIAGAASMPLAQPGLASPAQSPPSGSATSVGGKPSHADRQRATSNVRRAARRELRRRRLLLRTRRRLLEQHRQALEHRRMLELRRQSKRRQAARRRLRQVVTPPHPSPATPPAPAPSRPAHRHRHRTTTTSASEVSSSSSSSTTTASPSPSTVTGATTPKTSGHRRPQRTGEPSTGTVKAGASGASSTTAGSGANEHANDGGSAGASDPGSGAAACDAKAARPAYATVQPRGAADGHTHICPAAQEEEA